MSRKPQHKWTTSDRVILCLLYTQCYPGSTKNISLIFSDITKVRLRKEGFLDRIAETTLAGQFNEIRMHAGKGFQQWLLISQQNAGDLEHLCAKEVKAIKESALALNVQLTYRPPSHYRSASLKPKRASRLRAPSITTTTVTDFSEAESEDHPTKSRLSKYFFSQNEEHNTAIPLKLRRQTSTGTDSPRRHPDLLFRAIERQHPLRARAFRGDHKVVPPPPPIGSDELQSLMWPHLERDRSYLSPFMSLAQTPRPSLKIIETLKSENRADERDFAVFSFVDVVEAAEVLYGKANGLYLGRTCFELEAFNKLPDGYKAVGEWLAWGEVGCKPLAVIPCTTAIELARDLRALKTSDKDAAKDRIAQHLREIPANWAEVITFSLLRAYKVGRQLVTPGTEEYDEFMSTVLTINSEGGNAQRDIIMNHLHAETGNGPESPITDVLNEMANKAGSRRLATAADWDESDSDYGHDSLTRSQRETRVEGLTLLAQFKKAQRARGALLAQKAAVVSSDDVDETGIEESDSLDDIDDILQESLLQSCPDIHSKYYKYDASYQRNNTSAFDQAQFSDAVQPENPQKEHSDYIVVEDEEGRSDDADVEIWSICQRGRPVEGLRSLSLD